MINDKGEGLTVIKEPYLVVIAVVLWLSLFLCFNAAMTPNLINKEQVQIKMDSLCEIGVDPDLLVDLKFNLHPGPYIEYTRASGNGSGKILGTCKGKTITLVEGARMGTLYHEIGHAIHNQRFNTSGNAFWDFENEEALKYIELKGYSIELHYDAQINLEWEDRIAEWFAEDVIQFLAERLGEDCKPRRAGPEKTQEVDDFLEELILEQ